MCLCALLECVEAFGKIRGGLNDAFNFSTQKEEILPAWVL